MYIGGSYLTLHHLLVTLVPDTTILLPCPPFMVNLTSFIMLGLLPFYLIFLASPSGTSLDPHPLQALENTCPLLTHSLSSVILCGSSSSPYYHNCCSYADISNFMVTSPCAVPGTTAPLLKTSTAFLCLSDLGYKG